MKNDWFCNTVMLLLPKSLKTTKQAYNQQTETMKERKV